MDDGAGYAAFGLVAKSSGTAKFAAASSNFDTILAIERVDPDGSSETVAEDDDSGGGTNSALTMAVTAGTHYTMILTGASGMPSGSAVLSYSGDLLTPQLPPVRDTGPRSAVQLSSGNTQRPQAGTKILGCDTSEYQGAVNFGKLKTATSFVIVKSTDGTAFVDPQFAPSRTGAEAQGMEAGFYHFAEPTQGTAAEVRR